MENNTEKPYYYEVRDALINPEKIDVTNYLLDFIRFALSELGNFEEKDIRYDYFLLMLDLISNYRMNLKNFFFRVFFEYEKTKIKEELMSMKEEDFRGELDPIFFSYRSLKVNLERNLVVEAWSVFEFSITTIFEFVFTKDEIEGHQNKYSKAFKNIIKKGAQNLTDQEVEKIVNELIKQTDSFVPTINKINKIFKKEGTPYDEKEADFKFFQFFSQIRNGIHNNFIYKGPNKEDIEFMGNTYQFQDGKSILERAKGQFDEVALIGALFRCVLRFFMCLAIDEKIPNPLPTINELLDLLKSEDS